MAFNSVADYQQKAHETCEPQCWKEEYLIPGLVSEVGEYAGKFKREVRGDRNSLVDLPTLKALELGDICWYLAESSAFLNTGMQYLFPKIMRQPEAYTEYGWLCRLSAAASKIAVGQYDGFVEAWICVMALSQINGYSLQSVLDMNLSKLQSRQERNQIKGKGDAR